MMSDREDVTMTPDSPPPPPPGYTPGPPPPPAGAPVATDSGGSRRGGGAVWLGVVLVAVGGLMLARLLLPGFGLSGAWPVGIVALVVMLLGVKQMLTPGKEGEYRLNRVIEGLTTISIGVILLAQSVGALRWDAWLSVLSLWPLLLVAIGIDLIGKGTGTGLLRVASSAIVLAGLLYGAFVLPGAGSLWRGGWGMYGMHGRAGQEFERSAPPARGITQGRASVEGAVGELTVADGDDLAAASGRTPFGEPVFQVDTSGRRADVEISMGDRGVSFWPGPDAFMDVELSRDVEWDLVIDSGVSKLEADLSALQLSALKVSAGVTDARVTLGSDLEGEVPVAIEAGVSSIVVRVPRSVEARVVAETGLSNVSVGEGFDSVDGGRQTSGYGRARDRYVISVKSGITDVKIELY